MQAYIVEPSGFLRSVLQSFFTDPTWKVEALESGEDLLARVAQGPAPDLVCLPSITLDLTGQETAQRLRQLWPQLPIIQVTGQKPGDAAPEIPGTGPFTQTFNKSNLTPLADFITELTRHGLPPQQPKPRVLYVEDSKVAAKVLLHWAKEWQWDTTHYLSADEAWAGFNPADWDLVLTDYQLGGTMQGLDLVRAIRQVKDNRLPILVVSALTNQSEKVEILKAGANDFITKPIEKEELKARTATFLTMKALFDELENQKRAIAEMAMRDQLTGLFNRHSLAEIAPKLLHQALRKQSPLSVIILDLDHFKAINDQFGHQTGDAVLAETGQFLQKNLRKGDYAARFGGEEFVLILPDTALEGALLKAENLRQALAGLNPGGRPVTGSFGVACLDLEQTAGFNELFAQADAAVYKSKANGRNQVST